jgi:hypothetical protein
MPATAEREIRRRGGVIRFRTKKVSRDKYLRVAVVRRKGKRGGRTVAYVVKRKQPKGGNR